MINGALGVHMVGVQDMLSRNAILSAPFKMFANSRSNFNSLVSGDKISTDMLDEIHLGMSYRDVPYAQDPNGKIGSIVAIVSPGVHFDLQKQSEPRDWLGIIGEA